MGGLSSILISTSTITTRLFLEIVEAVRLRYTQHHLRTLMRQILYQVTTKSLWRMRMGTNKASLSPFESMKEKRMTTTENKNLDLNILPTIIFDNNFYGWEFLLSGILIVDTNFLSIEPTNYGLGLLLTLLEDRNWTAAFFVFFDGRLVGM